jgi:hypothetical protein
MRNFLYIVFVFFFVSSCKPGIPKDIIQPEEMAKVLHDIHIVDGYVNLSVRPDSVKIIAASYYKGIYKKYDIDSALYAKSMDYYYREPKALNDIYVKVTADLTKEKNVIVKADSLVNAKEIMKARLKITRDSTRKADSTFWTDFLLKDSIRLKLYKLKDTVKLKGKAKLKGITKLKDTAKLKDTVKKKIDVIRLKMNYKGLTDLK